MDPNIQEEIDGMIQELTERNVDIRNIIIHLDDPSRQDSIHSMLKLKIYKLREAESIKQLMYMTLVGLFYITQKHEPK